MNNEYLIKQIIKAALKSGKEILRIYSSPDFGVEFKSDQSPLTLADKKAHEVIVGYLYKTGLPVLSEEGKEIPFEERNKWEEFWMVDPLDGTKEFIKKNGEFTVNIALIKNGFPVMGVVYAPVLDDLYWGEIQTGAFKVENASKIILKELSEESLAGMSQKLPIQSEDKPYRIVASRSHLSDETQEYIELQKKKYGDVEIVSKGSSLKLCMIAEGQADVYPRYAPTMEWDTAAGDAIIRASGGTVVRADSDSNLVYNKENLLNPWFLASRQ